MTQFTHTDVDGDVLKVQDYSGATGEAAWIKQPGDTAVLVPKADAPAVALAILEAAGWTAEASPISASRPGNAVYALRKHVEEVKEEAGLDNEALFLLNAATDSAYVSFPNETIRETWRKAARRAREIHS